MKAKFFPLSVNYRVNPSELIEGCKRGDHKAQLQAYKLYYSPVYFLCLEIVNDPVTAENLMHESFLEAFENIDSYSGETSFCSWIKKFIKYDL